MDLTEFFNTLLGYCVSYGGRLVIAAVILIVGFRISGVAARRFRRGKISSKMDPTMASFLQNFISLAFKVLLIVSAIGVMGVPMSSVITVIAAVSASIGLALQGSLSNLAGGIMLAIFRPFHVGECISTQNVIGTVTEIGLFYTAILTADNKRVTLPNGTLMNSTVINYSANETVRVDLPFSVAYASDVDRVRQTLLSVADAHPMVLKDPAAVVHMTKHGDSALQFTLRVWCKREDYWTVQWDLTEQVKRGFDQSGIEIPFPQMDVHIRDNDNG